MTADASDALGRLIGTLADLHVAYCVVGGQAVNAYVEPLVSLDLDLVVAAPDLERILPVFASDFRIERFPHSVNVSAPESDLRIQFQLDPRYAQFVAAAERRQVLGIELPVARLEDVLQGKVWAALDSSRRPSKRQKDLADIARLLERFPHLSSMVPREIKDHLVGG